MFRFKLSEKMNNLASKRCLATVGKRARSKNCAALIVVVVRVIDCNLPLLNVHVSAHVGSVLLLIVDVTVLVFHVLALLNIKATFASVTHQNLHLLRAAQRAAERKLAWGRRVGGDAECALWTARALGLGLGSASHVVVEAGLAAELVACLEDKERNRAAVEALEVNELVAVDLTKLFAVSKRIL